ncbi:MAG: hypothetical protein M3R43_08715 [Acidobacteriota bacterium]|nr:hypothetical protein [Acidobacteriota bacterium]
MNEPRSDTANPSTTSPLLIAAAWLVVLVPTGWGLSYTVQNALKIFDHAPVPAATVTPPAR